MLIFKRTLSLRYCFALSLLLTGLLSCQESSTSDSNGDSGAQEGSELLCHTFCSSNLPAPQSGPDTNQVEWVVQLTSQSETGEPGVNLGELLDSLSWEIQFKAEGDYYLPSIEVQSYESSSNGCPPQKVRLGTPEFSEDSSFATLPGYLTLDNAECQNHELSTGGILVVVVAEGLPGGTGAISQYQKLQAWKGGKSVPLTHLTQE